MFINSLINYFIHPKIKEDGYSAFKAKALIWLHLIVYLFIILALGLELIADMHNDLPSWVILGVNTILLLILKYKGDIVISGTLVGAAVGFMLGPNIIKSGGVISDNLIWCAFLPIISLLFGNLRVSFLFLVILILFSVYLTYGLEYDWSNPFFKNYTPAYYFFSYNMFFCVLFFMIFTFRREQESLIKSLTEKNRLLELQKVEITKKTKDLEEAKGLLEASNKELEQFAYVASHDLKEPLRMIAMYTQMLQRRLKQYLDEDTKEFMGFVIEGVKRMQQMLDDLLNYSKLGKNHELQAVDLNNTMFLVEQNLKMILNDTGGVFTYDSLPTIYAVNSEITQLFQNLIANGIKFHNKDRNPEVKVFIHKIDIDSFTICVKDNGIGVPKDSIERVFNLFERLNNREEYEGTGIGLATCRKVMDNLGGEIWLESEEGIGSSFFLKFPNATLEPIEEDIGN